MPLTFDFTHKLLFLCLQHKNGPRIDFNSVAEELGGMTSNAVELRYRRIKKAIEAEQGDKAPGPDGEGTPSKVLGKGQGGRKAAPRSGRKRKVADQDSDEGNLSGEEHKAKVEKLTEVVKTEEAGGV